MKKGIFLFIQLLLFINGFCQRKVEKFHFGPVGDKVRGSLYSTIKIVDIREDTTNLGFIQKGALNKRVEVIADESLNSQLSVALKELNEPDAGNGEMLLLIRKMFFLEATGSFSERGFLQFRANLFRKENDKYHSITFVDTVLVVKGVDVTKKLLLEGGKLITEFLAENLTKEPNQDLTITYEQLLSIDSVEKAAIPLYANLNLTDGIYKSFKSFEKQQPDEPDVKVDFSNKGKVKSIYHKNARGEFELIDYQFIYALVYKGKPYISGTFNAYPLIKKNNEFHFIGKVPDAKSGEIAAATAFFGVLGGALFGAASTSEFQFMLDHLTGAFIKIREIDKYHHDNKKTRYDIQ